MRRCVSRAFARAHMRASTRVHTRVRRNVRASMHARLECVFACVRACGQACGRTGTSVHACVQFMHACVPARAHTRACAREHRCTHECLDCARASGRVRLRAHAHACEYARARVRTCTGTSVHPCMLGMRARLRAGVTARARPFSNASISASVDAHLLGVHVRALNIHARMHASNACAHGRSRTSTGTPAHPCMLGARACVHAGVHESQRIEITNRKGIEIEVRRPQAN